MDREVFRFLRKPSLPPSSMTSVWVDRPRDCPTVSARPRNEDDQAMPRPNRPTVLNVDDNDQGRYIFSHILQEAGFHVLEARTGTGALAMARDLPDLVLLDVKLSDIDGLEVCRRLKADPATSGIPVLQVSAAFSRNEDWATGMSAGADGCLVG